MKKALNAWSVPDDVGFDEMFHELKAHGFEGVELNVDAKGRQAHSLTLETTVAELENIKAQADQAGIEITSISTSLGGQTGSNQADLREQQRAVLLKQLACARILGADAILTVPGGMDVNPPAPGHGPNETTLKEAQENSLRFS